MGLTKKAKKINYAYKVVVVTVSGSQISCFARYADGYCLKYNLNEETRAIPGTLGIFCFKTIPAAWDFAIRCLNTDCKNNSVKLFKVQTKGRGTTPKLMGIYNSLRYYYFANETQHPKENYVTPEVPLGTVCYPAITPVEEVTYELN